MKTLSDVALIRRLAFDNPWWGLTPDRDVIFKRGVERAQLPGFLDAVRAAGSGRALVLAGPLHAGKTVLMRQAIARLIEGGAEPQSVLYTSLAAGGYTGAHPDHLVRAFLAHHHFESDAELFVFLDEAQYLPDWQAGLIAIATEFPNVRFVAAVSAGAPLLVSGDAGDTDVFVLPPLTFAEFLSLRGSDAGLVAEAADGFSFQVGNISALNAEFRRYMVYGGFVGPIAHPDAGGAAQAHDRTAESVLHRDLSGLFGIADGQDLLRLFALVALNTASETSIEELASESGVAKNTVRKYLDYLENAFLVRRLPRLDRNAEPFQRAVSFKVHLVTPSLYSALYGPPDVGSEAEGRLAETALVAQVLGNADFASLSYASWRGGSVDWVERAGFLDPIRVVGQCVWSGDEAEEKKRARWLASFGKDSVPDARAQVMTRRLAGPGSARGHDLSFLPMAAYAYALGKG